MQSLAKVALNPPLLGAASLPQLASHLHLDQALHPLLHHAQVPGHLALEPQTRPAKSLNVFSLTTIMKSTGRV